MQDDLRVMTRWSHSGYLPFVWLHLGSRRAGYGGLGRFSPDLPFFRLMHMDVRQLE